ncbi:MAG TPA: aldehyde dehydrogenase family protein [Solirubrobacterales bacterium]|nr:aldehyde dehydrogenase family protein [Solirubrobacterales bacterium]
MALLRAQECFESATQSEQSEFDHVLSRDWHYIDGEWAHPFADGSLEVINPATEERLGRAPAGTREDADRAVSAASIAADEWARTPVPERAAVLRNFADALTRRRDLLARLLASEVGVPTTLARGHQTSFPIWTLNRYADLIEETELEEHVGNSLVLREAVGVVAAISPWNFPLLLAVNKVAPALAAGCPVVLKPSELAPLSAFVLADAAAEADIPPGVFNLVSGTGHAVGQALAAHPAVALVSLTGSTAAGRRVAELSAATIKRVQLELGGKSANVVLEDADLPYAVQRGLEQCFWNSGQNCMAWSRMLVPREHYAEVLQLAESVADSYRVGDPLDAETEIGPLISAPQRDRVRAYIQSGLAEGAKLVSGGTEAPYSRGYYVVPTVLADVRNQMKVAREEIFGPVLCILPYATEDEAVAIANETPYGLHGAVFSTDPEHAVAVARRLKTGMVDLNGAPLNPEAPFGGCKQSGLGRELGRWALEEYFELKSVQL